MSKRLRPLVVRIATIGLLSAVAFPALNSTPHAPKAAADATTSVDDRSVAVPTGWRVYSGVSASFITSTVLSGGYRLTELHPDQATSPTTWTVRAVPNSGAYAVGSWWWYYGQTQAQVNSLIGTNKARLISVDGYNTASGTRYAVVMVDNTSTHTKSFHWYVNSSATTIVNSAVSAGDRVIDWADFIIGSTRYYAAVTVHNTAPDAKGWYVYVGQTVAQVSSLLSSKRARLVDLEATGSNTWDVVMTVDSPGFWVWYTGRPTPQGLLDLAAQTGTRLISVQRYTTGSSTVYFAGVFLNNLAAPSSTMRDLEFAKLGGFNKWGFYSKQVGGPVLTALQSGARFEPASAIKVVQHLYVHMRLQNKSVSLTDLLSYHYRSGDSSNKDICPQDADPTASTTLATADTQMMDVSDNRMTRAIKDKYGYSNILAVANILGMSNTAFPNILGCLTYGTYNLTTLSDLGKLYESVAAGTSINGTTRQHFYDNMLNMNNYSSARTFFCNVATTEGQALSKSPSTITAFCNAMQWAAKGGSYTLNLSNGRHIWRSNFARLALPVKSPATTGPITLSEYVYGDFIHGVIATTAQETAIGDARNAAAAEQFRKQIHDAIATW